MKNLFALLLGYALSITGIHAQFIISGKVTGRQGVPVAYGQVVQLHAHDSSFIRSALTDSTGAYTLSAAVVESTLLLADAEGYMKQYKKLQPGKSQSIDFEMVALSKLAETTISASKPLIEQKPDRMVFNVENSIAAAGSDAFETLKRTPGVQVIGDQILITGKSTVSVMINGRLQQLSGADLVQLLRAVPSDQVSRIEVITSPPARYDAQGQSGLINIVTKKTLKDGLRGNVNASLNKNTYFSPSVGTTLNYRNRQLNVYTNASIFRWAQKDRNDIVSYYPGLSQQQVFNQHFENDFARLQIGADYGLGKRATLGIVYNTSVNDIESGSRTVVQTYIMQQPDSFTVTDGFTLEKFRKKHNVNLNYEWNIDTLGRKLNIDLDYFTQTSDRNRDFVSQTFNMPGSGERSVNRVYGEYFIDIRSVKADLEWPLKFASVSGGVKSAYVRNSSENIFQTVVSDAFITDLSKTNTFIYDEYIQAGYVSIKKNIKKWSFQAGYRGEHTSSRGVSPTTGQSIPRAYFKGFPSMSVNYRYSDQHNFSLSITRRLERPNYSQLNPFRFYRSNNSYIDGNPYLIPAYTYNTEFRYSYRSKYFFTLFNNNTVNIISRISNIDTATNSIAMLRANIGKENATGIYSFVAFSIFKWWETRNSGGVRYALFQLDHYSAGAKYSMVNAWLETGHSFYFGKKKIWSAELNAYYYSPQMDDYKRRAAMVSMSAGIRAQLLDKNLVISLNADDITYSAWWRLVNKADGTRSDYYDDERSVRLAVTYKFGNSNVKSRRDRNITTDEIKRVN